jgi:16S rRNA (guanine1207-N2)-methyltransferase
VHIEGQGGGVSRPGAPAAATEVAIGALHLLDAGSAPLVVDEPSGRLADALATSGHRPRAWLRFAGGASAAAPWPPSGPFSSAFVRLPKSKDALEMTLHAAAGSVPAGAPITLFGANDEGIKSAGRLLAAVCEAVEVVDARRHCRVLMGRRRAVIEGLKAHLAQWRRTAKLTVGGEQRDWVSYPGVFASGRLDEGTALLLAHLPPLTPASRVLDFGCGTGVIGAGLLAREPAAKVEMLDADALAIAAARENVPGARTLVATDLGAVAGTRYHFIVSNPPLHSGVREDHAVLLRLIADAPARLTRGGRLLIVVQRRVKAAEPIQAAFGNVEVVAETGTYRVLAATAGQDKIILAKARTQVPGRSR